MQELARYIFSPPVWLVLGMLLIALELIVPGAVIIFFGVGALITGLLTWLGILTGVGAQLWCWLGSSLVLVLLFRRKIADWFPALERYEPKPDWEDMIGTEVPVLEDVYPVGRAAEFGVEENSGRVRYQGAAWMASAPAGRSRPIYSGETAKIIDRKNLLLIVESRRGSAGNADSSPIVSSDASTGSAHANPYD